MKFLQIPSRQIVNRIQRSVYIAIASLASLVAVPQQVLAANVTLSLNPSSSSVQQGSEVDVVVRLDLGSARSLDAIGTVNYPADKLQFLSASGPGNDGPDRSVSAEAYRFDLISNSTPFSGNVTVVTLKFRAIAEGSAALSISGASVGDYDSPPPATHTVNAGSASINLTAPPAPQPAANTSNSGSSSSGGSTGGSTGVAAPTEQVVQANAELDDETPVPATAYTDETGYPVDIKVRDKDGLLVKQTKVNIGDKSATTNDQGVASFSGIKAGMNTVEVRGTKTEIDVKTGDPAVTQEFTVNVKEGMPTWLTYVLIGLAFLIALAVLGLLAKTIMGRLGSGKAPKVVVSNPYTGSFMTESIAAAKKDIDIKAPADLKVPKPDEVIQPTKPKE